MDKLNGFAYNWGHRLVQGAAMDQINTKAQKVETRLSFVRRNKQWLADQIGICKTRIANYLRESSIRKDIDLANALGVSPAWLIDEKRDLLEQLNSTSDDKWKFAGAGGMLRAGIERFGSLNEYAEACGVTFDEMRFVNETTHTLSMISFARTARYEIDGLFERIV